MQMVNQSTTYNSMQRKGCVGNEQPSSCTPYTGPKLKTIHPDEVCNPSIDDILVNFDGALYKLEQSLDTMKVNGLCIPGIPTSLAELESFEWWRIINAIIKAHCELKTAYENSNKNVLEQEIEIDLSCLGTPECAARTRFKIGEVFTIMMAQICALKNS